MAKINRFALLLCTLVLLASSVRAQNPESFYEETPRTFYGGVIVGANGSQIDGDNYAGYHKLGINAGGIIYTEFAPHFAASLELLYAQKGSKSNGPTASNVQGLGIINYSIKLDYAEIPIQLNYFDKQRSHFGAGFSFSRLVSTKETIQTSGTSLPPGFSFDNYPFQKWDYNFIVSANLHVFKGLFVTGRFQYSLASIRKNGPVEFARSSQFNNLVVLRLMYLF